MLFLLFLFLQALLLPREPGVPFLSHILVPHGVEAAPVLPRLTQQWVSWLVIDVLCCHGWSLDSKSLLSSSAFMSQENVTPARFCLPVPSADSLGQVSQFWTRVDRIF